MRWLSRTLPRLSGRDESNLKRSEQRYRSLTEALPQMVWTANDAGDISYYSNRWFEYTGIPTAELLARGWQRIVHPADLAGSSAAYSYAVAHGTPFEAEQRLRRADGAYRWHLSRGLPLREGSGPRVQWLGTATDIDDQKRALEIQRRLAEQLGIIVEATDRLVNALDMQEALQALSDLVTPKFADWMSVEQIDSGGRIRNVALAQADPAKAAAAAAIRGSYYLDPNVRGVTVTVLDTQKPQVEPDYRAAHPDFSPMFASKRAAIAELGMASLICVPLLVRGRTVGALSAVWSQSDLRYDVAEVPFFEELGNRAAVVFDAAARRSLARVNEEIARRIMQSSEDCIAILSLDARLITINEHGAADFRAAGAALEPGSDWRNYWRQEDAAATTTALDAARGGSTGTYQGRLIGGPDPAQWWDVVVTPITNVAGSPTQLLAVSRNITRQKDYESTLQAVATRYRAFANAIPALAFTAGPEGALDFVNDRWLEYTGLSYEQSLAHGLAAVTHGDEAPTLTGEWFAAIESGRLHETETQLRRAADAAYRWHLMRAVPIRGVDGRIVQWFGTATDIDDQKRAEATLAAARDEALSVATVKARFLATMSHEIRTPISGVIGMTELLLTTTLSAEQREYVDVVHDSGQSLLHVVNDILDYSKLEAGKVQLESIEFDVAGLMRSATDTLRTQFEEKHIGLTAQVAPDVPAVLVGDAPRLRQVLVNLIGNAVKFTPPRGAVEVNATRIASDGGTVVRFEVRDTGPGIAADAQQRLFEAFTQADGSTTRRHGGTGLGLSISKQLVTLMHGTIGVDSAPGEGSSFWFALEFERASGALAGTAPSPRAPAERVARGPASSAKILLVEDNQTGRLLAQRQFAALGFAIASASNGVEALKALNAEHYDLVFMDCHMPEIDGFEATREVRRLESGTTSRTPIVALTADAQVEDQAACLAAGMDDYVSKPISLAQLQAVLERWLPPAVPDVALVSAGTR